MRALEREYIPLARASTPAGPAVATSAAERHLEHVRFGPILDLVRFAVSLDCWRAGIPTDLLDDFVFHIARFPAYLSRVSGDDDGDFEETVRQIVHSVSVRLALPVYYSIQWDTGAGSRPERTAQNISTWCLCGGPERFRWMRGEVWVPPWIGSQARLYMTKALRRHAVPALVAAGWTQRRVAQVPGCSVGTVSNVLSRHRRATPGASSGRTGPKRWTADEDKAVSKALQKGVTEKALKTLSRELGRTPGAIRRHFFFRKSRARARAKTS